MVDKQFIELLQQYILYKKFEDIDVLLNDEMPSANNLGNAVADGWDVKPTDITAGKITAAHVGAMLDSLLDHGIIKPVKKTMQGEVGVLFNNQDYTADLLRILTGDAAHPDLHQSIITLGGTPPRSASPVEPVAAPAAVVKP